MLKAIRNFVRQRSRYAQQTPSQVVEGDDTKDLPIDPEAPLQLAEPQLEERTILIRDTALSSSRTEAETCFSMRLRSPASASPPCSLARRFSSGRLLGSGACRWRKL